MTTLQPPSGEPPPESAVLPEGEEVDLVPIALEICSRYRDAFPDEQQRYGDAGHAWCVHDNLYQLFWAFEAASGYLDMTIEVAWLARVLESRDFPLVRLARNLEIAADVLQEQLPSGAGPAVVDEVAAAAVFVRSRTTFLD